MKNVCFFTGNITRELELRRTPTGKAVLDFSIAVNKRMGDREAVNFFNIVAWEEDAERIVKFFKKGRPIEVECEAFNDSWEDKNSGEKRTRDKYTLLRWEFPLSSKPKDSDDSSDDEEDEVEETPAPKKRAADRPAAKPAAKQTPAPKKNTRAENVEDDDPLDF